MYSNIRKCQNPCGFLVDSIWNVELGGIHMESRWNGCEIYIIVPDGFQMVIPWNIHGIHMEWYGFQVEWNHQNGWNLTQNIFHMEWVESTWNDIDSTWIQCGMWGEGKDLPSSIARAFWSFYVLCIGKLHHCIHPVTMDSEWKVQGL